VDKADSSHGYERYAGAFMASRKARSVGLDTVMAWARSLSPGGAIIDLGCGDGVPLSAALAAQGFSVHGVDASPTLAAAFARNLPGVPVACEAVQDSLLFSRSFDAALAWGLVFLLPAGEQVALVEKVGKALGSGGRLLFTAPREACNWTDVLTGERSVSIGAPAYVESLDRAGLTLLREYVDEGGNHYFDARRR
jgi:2-polyprenyl-3-methyl-5-hydroxy-6-metoxy-1,4-benzoquinol methylase